MMNEVSDACYSSGGRSGGNEWMITNPGLEKEGPARPRNAGERALPSTGASKALPGLLLTAQNTLRSSPSQACISNQHRAPPSSTAGPQTQHLRHTQRRSPARMSYGEESIYALIPPKQEVLVKPPIHKSIVSWCG